MSRMFMAVAVFVTIASTSPARGQVFRNQNLPGASQSRYAPGPMTAPVTGGASRDLMNPAANPALWQYQLEQMESLQQSLPAEDLTPAQQQSLQRQDALNQSLARYAIYRGVSQQTERLADALSRGERQREARARAGKREVQGPVTTPTERVTGYFGRIAPRRSGQYGTPYYEEPNRYYPQGGYSR